LKKRLPRGLIDSSCGVILFVEGKLMVADDKVEYMENWYRLASKKEQVDAKIEKIEARLTFLHSDELARNFPEADRIQRSVVKRLKLSLAALYEARKDITRALSD
jgi:hypothetical protein